MDRYAKQCTKDPSCWKRNARKIHLKSFGNRRKIDRYAKQCMKIPSCYQNNVRKIYLKASENPRKWIILQHSVKEFPRKSFGNHRKMEQSAKQRTKQPAKINGNTWKIKVLQKSVRKINLKSSENPGIS